MLKPVALGAVALITLAGCNPASMETEPVTIQTAKGPVVCQLYSKNIVAWDRSIMRPPAMSVTEADAICNAEGVKQKNS